MPKKNSLKKKTDKHLSPLCWYGNAATLPLDAQTRLFSQKKGCVCVCVCAFHLFSVFFSFFLVQFHFHWKGHNQSAFI